MSGMGRINLVQPAATGNLLQARMQEAVDHTVLETLVKVADFIKFIANPTGVYFVFQLLQHRLAEIVFQQRFKRGLRREHSALESQVNTFLPLRIEKAG